MGSETPKRRSGVRVLGCAFVALLVLLILVAGIGYLAWRSKPGHWEDERERIAAMPQAQRDAVSEALLSRVLDEWSAAPDNARTADDLIGQRTEIQIPFDELNVLLANNGTQILADFGIELPPEVRAAMVDSPGEGLLRLSCEVNSPEIDQVVALTFDIAVSEDGTVSSTLKDATAGRLPLPTETAVGLLAEQGGQRAAELLRGEPFGPIDVPIDPSENGLRDGRLVGLEVTGDAMVVTRETVRRQRAN